jgi:hypothetical protein
MEMMLLLQRAGEIASAGGGREGYFIRVTVKDE